MNGGGAITIKFGQPDNIYTQPSYIFPPTVLSSDNTFIQTSYTVKWANPDLGTDYLVSSSTRTNLTYGNYLVEYKGSYPEDNGGGTQIIGITVSSGVTVDVVGVKDTTCSLDNGAVTGVTTTIYPTSVFNLYNTNNTLIQTQSISGQYCYFGSLTAGTYYLTNQDDGGSSAKTKTFIVSDSNVVDFGLQVLPDSYCNSKHVGKITVTGETGIPPYTYLWNTFNNGNTITGLTKGVYSVTVTDSTNCSSTKSAYVDVTSPLGVESVYTISPTCLKSNGSFTMTISGGTEPFYYSISNGYSEISYSRILSLSGLSSLLYKIDITDSSLCKISNTIDLLPEDGGIAEVTISNKNSTCSSDNGSITIGLRNGNPPFTYTLINLGTKDSIIKYSYQNQYLFEQLKSGDYEISVQDSTECSHSEKITITNEDKFTISAVSTGTTYGQSNGFIEVSVSSNGLPPFNYFLDDEKKILKTNLTKVTFNKISGGQHIVKVIDKDGCLQIANVSVENTQPVNFSLFSKISDLGDNGEITALISSGVPPFTYIWSNNVSGNPQSITANGLSAGTYSLTIIDSNKSSSKKEVEVFGDKRYESYELYEMGTDVFKTQSNTKYGLLQILNEGYNDIVSGNTECDFNSATFNAVVTILPFEIVTTQEFFTTTSLSVAPPENLWYDTVKSLLMGVKGVYDVVINEFDNNIKIITDVNNSNIISGPDATINIVVDLNIDYDINCRTIMEA